MLSRRSWLRQAAGTGAALALAPRLAHALRRDGLHRKPIPATGELLPVIGLGSSATFSAVARSEDVTALREVLRAMADQGATLFDTAPSYGSSEEVAGRLVHEMGIAARVFWATKVNAAGRGPGATADPAQARAQLEQSFARVQRPVIDLIQVHNMADVPTHLGALRELKRAGRVRYVGVTTTFPQQYAELVAVLRNEPLDFIGIDYAADNRDVEETILPLAQERKVAVLAYAPFGRTSLLRRVGDRPLPDWAATIDATSWPQVFLKWVVSHPAITAATPATSQARHMLDNLAGGVGRLPDAALRATIAAYVDALPPAPARSR